jgi:hypothetical protein
MGEVKQVRDAKVSFISPKIVREGAHGQVPMKVPTHPHHVAKNGAQRSAMKNLKWINSNQMD